MPSRLIRDGILESEQVLGLPVEARWLYLSILLGADDVGLFEATPFRLARRADIRREHAEKLVQMLADCDLIRLYSADCKAYGFIPKYGQRIQIKRARCPLPPIALLHGDEDAINKINSLGLNPRLANGDTRKSTVGQPSEPEPEPEKKETPLVPRGDGKEAMPTIPCPYGDIIEAYHSTLPSLPKARLLPASRQRAMRKVWGWVLSSSKSDGSRRACTAEEAIAWLRGYFERAGMNDFLMGRTPRSAEHANWQCDLDFLLTDKGMKQVIEKTQDAA